VRLPFRKAAGRDFQSAADDPGGNVVKSIHGYYFWRSFSLKLRLRLLCGGFYDALGDNTMNLVARRDARNVRVRRAALLKVALTFQAIVERINPLLELDAILGVADFVDDAELIGFAVVDENVGVAHGWEGDG